MRLRPEQLKTHLERSGKMPVYFVSGDEPLQKLESIDPVSYTHLTLPTILLV